MARLCELLKDSSMHVQGQHGCSVLLHGSAVRKLIAWFYVRTRQFARNLIPDQMALIYKSVFPPLVLIFFMAMRGIRCGLLESLQE